MEFESMHLTGIALVTSIALLFGIGLERLKQPAIVGYILAGIALGPTGFGLIKDSHNVSFLAELGVIMLLFIIGMELSIRSFISVFKIAVACTIIQISVALILCFVFGKFLGWSSSKIVLLGFIFALSSTAVAIKMLEELGHLKDPIGQMTVGILVAQDLALVPMLLLADSFGQESGLSIWVLVKILVAVVFLVGLIWYLSRKDKIVLPLSKWFTSNLDLAPLTAMAFCFCAATLSGALGMSTAYGAFLAGLVISSSAQKDQLLKVTHPIQSVLVVVFFLSIGLMIDLKFIFSNFLTVMFFLLVVISLKTVLNIGTLRFLGQSWDKAFPAGLVMAQIGEFSFVLATIGYKGGVIQENGHRLAISVIALSLLMSPLWLVTVRRFHDVAADNMGNIRLVLLKIYQGEITTLAQWAGLIKKSFQKLRRK